MGSKYYKNAEKPNRGRKFFSNFMEVIKKCSKEEVELFTVTARKIWLRRNTVVFGGMFSHPTQLLKEAKAVLEDFKRMNTSSSLPSVENHPPGEEKWVPPPLNLVKINWDAAVDSSNKIIGLGMIARDERGKFLAACSKRQSINVEPVVAEALAATQAILFCQEHNFQKVIFEGDSL
jgi:hypothetical protein